METVNADSIHPEYPVFKGLQKPLEFMGLQGRYIYWAAATAGSAIVGFIIGYLVVGFLAGIIILALVAAFGTGLIFFKQRRGLHSKKCAKGVYVYFCSHRL